MSKLENDMKNSETTENTQQRYDSILQLANLHGKKGAPPVEQWNPPFCGDLDMQIERDGTWFYGGTPIGRMPLVKLFASVLRREDDGSYVLVTPVEKTGLTVADVPFIGAELSQVVQDDGVEALVLRTNVDDVVVISADHPLRFVQDDANGGLVPYCHIRGRLEARLARPLLYQLAEMGCERVHEGAPWFGVVSCDVFFPMMAMDELEQFMAESSA